MSKWIRIKLSDRQRSAFECSYVDEPQAAIDEHELALSEAYQHGIQRDALEFEAHNGELILDALLELINLNSDIAEGIVGGHDKDERSNARGDSRAFDSVWNRVQRALKEVQR